MSAWWITGCIYGASSVMLGAFGAHGLKARVSDPAKIASFQTAAHYQVRKPKKNQETLLPAISCEDTPSRMPMNESTTVLPTYSTHQAD